MTQRPGRRGFTLIEALMVVALGASLLALAIEAFRFFSTRTTTTGERIEAARDASFFLERLHRILRVPFRVIPTSRGFLVLHSLRRDASGKLVWDETLFELVEAGVLVIEHGGKTFRYRVGEDPGDGEALLVDVMQETLVVRIPGVDEVMDADLVVSPLGVDPAELLVADRAEAEAALAAWEERDGWLRSEEAEREGTRELGSAGFGVPGPVEDAEPGAGAGSLRDGLDLEVAVLGIEERPIGRALLPAELPDGLAPGTILEAAPWFEEAGFPYDESVRIAILVRTWEEALLAGDRRGAAKALAEADGLLRAGGQDPAGSMDLIASASPVAAELVGLEPDAVDAAARPEEDVRVTETLIDTDLGNLPDPANQVAVPEVSGAGGVGPEAGDPAAGTARDLIDPTNGEDLGPEITIPEPIPGPGGAPAGGGAGNGPLPGGLPPADPGENEAIVDIQDPGSANFSQAYVDLINTLAQNGTMKVFLENPDGVYQAVTWRKSGGSGSPSVDGSVVDQGGGSVSIENVNPGDRLVIRTTGDFLTILQTAGGAGKVFTVD